MPEFLLAAEVDQIQDFIFRASHLREVVGGSQLLARFCREMPGYLLDAGTNADVVVRDGGAFRVVFTGADGTAARRFGADLAEAWRRVADGALTVAEPVEIVNQNFAAASAMAEEQLRRAKLGQPATIAVTPQLPLIALCASCGVGLAVAHQQRHADERADYICQSCLGKVKERDRTGANNFLTAFHETVVRKPIWPDGPEDLAHYDARRYVAYLVADGNNLGNIFGICDRKQMRELSRQMTKALRMSLAIPTRKLRRMREDHRCDLPVLPLILGGDDLFALLPAPWALAFAQEFCREFEQRMSALLSLLKLPASLPRPTLAAAVVVCKASYPYQLAYRAGQARLKQAKRMSKALAYKTGLHLSVVDFEVIVGSQIVEAPPTGDARPTLRPYLVLPEGQALPQNWGLPLNHLIEQRWQLRALPGKRLAQLRAAFDALPPRGAEHDAWASDLGKLLGRIGRDKVAGETTAQALVQLGSAVSGWQYEINRATDEKAWAGYGLPDLLNAWQFAFSLDRERNDYEEA